MRAVVIGAGFAGEGHTLALRECGVDVVAICARESTVVRGVADRLGIAEASTDWRRTLERVRPEIVAIATPASVRGEAVETATALGCHLFCEKPLAATAVEAQQLYRLVEQARVKHAYASTHRYDPSTLWLGELVQAGAIGTVREIEYTFRGTFPPLAPWGWWSILASGGGMLNNWFTHVLGMLTTITGGDLLRAMGEARIGRAQAPVVPDIHDFRVLWTGEKTPTAEQAAQLEWRATDADSAFSALLTATSAGAEVPVSVLVSDLAVVPSPPTGWRLYGDEGALLADGLTSFAITRLRDATAEREALAVPQRLIDTLPRVGSDEENKWTALARDFVADVRGEPHRPYLTFRDGWRYQEAIDAIRSGRGWYTLPL